ncbi:MAG TPA: hypothetical protein VF449_09310, partial [Parvibaculum sp.]
MTKAKFLVAAGMAALVGLPVLMSQSASADDADLRAVNNRLDRLERSVNDMQQQSYGGGSSSGGSAPAGGGSTASADTEARLGEIEEQMRSLTGRIDELDHKITQTQQDLQTYKADQDLRMQDMQKGGAGAAPAGAAPVAGGAP